MGGQRGCVPWRDVNRGQSTPGHVLPTEFQNPEWVQLLGEEHLGLSGSVADKCGERLPAEPSRVLEVKKLPSAFAQQGK